jgi:hypothetical protein
MLPELLCRRQQKVFPEQLIHQELLLDPRIYRLHSEQHQNQIQMLLLQLQHFLLLHLYQVLPGL